MTEKTKKTPADISIEKVDKMLAETCLTKNESLKQKGYNDLYFVKGQPSSKSFKK